MALDDKKIELGMLIRTNYSGPYRVKRITRDCTCPLYVDTLNMRNPPPTRPHMHIVCTRPDGSDEYYLNHYDEYTLLSLGKSCLGGIAGGGHDHIELLGFDRPTQRELF